jgi:hypothetical protein
MSKEFRKNIGFTNKGKMKEWLGAKDLVIPNYPLLHEYNTRLFDIFSKVNSQLSVPFTGDIQSIIHDDFETMKKHDILQRMNNHGRSLESVYYSWRMGSLAEIVFAPFIADKLGLKNIEKNGSDDLTNPETFKRTGDADLIDRIANIRIDVQCGTGEGDATIKKHKFDHAAKNDGTTYIFLAGLLTGTYALVNLSNTTNVVFEENKSWEGTLCWTVPTTEFKPYHE